MYQEKDLVRVAKRENNTKRSYLVVDPLQGKHIPVSPTKALEVFEALGELLQEIGDPQKILTIGFAETATAIGAGVAAKLGTTYLQTTREVIEGASYLFFSEEHSHATEQKLVREDVEKAAESKDHILFVEDEVTTGKTILNIINILKKNYPQFRKFSVASLLNGMEEENLERYRAEGIDLYYLVKTDHKEFAQRAEEFKGDGKYHSLPGKGEEKSEQKYREIKVPGLRNTRHLTEPTDYRQALASLVGRVLVEVPLKEEQKMLVLGTEECMYPALLLGKSFEQLGYAVQSHSTTRSPIAVSSEEMYPLHERYELRSLYDDSRVTYLYDIAAYDQVIIVTDAQENGVGTDSLIAALAEKNTKITLIRWMENEKYL